jgi:hypothetical protein
MYGVHITAGLCGETKLDGIKFAFGGKFPGAIHEGGGTAKIWIEERASEGQRSALADILTGKLGGLPWIIFSATIDHWLDIAYVPFDWKYDGPHSYYKAGTEIQTALDSMRNPVSGAEARATILLPDGLVTKELHATATRVFSVFTKGLKIAAPGRYGFYSAVEHGN